jgi:hypothetical protein
MFDVVPGWSIRRADRLSQILKLLASWAATAEQTGDLPTYA